MRFKSLKPGKLKDEPEEEIIEVDKNSAGQITEMQKHISNKTKDLEEAKQQLHELADTVNYAGEPYEKPKPHGPLRELSVEPEDKMMDIELDTSADEESPEINGDEIQLFEVNTDTATPAETSEPDELKLAAEAASVEGEDDSFNNLFSTDEEEINPLATLISSLPDVSVQELMDDLQEIKDIILDNKKTE